VQTCRAAGDPGLADRTAGIPEPGAAGPNATIACRLLQHRGTLRGLSVEEIARLLRRDHGEVKDKVAEVGRACRQGIF
jgi:hypothetical protein